MKKSFALLSTLIVLVIFSYLSINIIQNKTYSSQINKLKYLEIQGQIHLKYIKQNILNNPIINDNRFDLKIYQDLNKTNTIYHIYLKTKDDSHISFYEKIIK